MEEILISVLTTMGFGINGVINGNSVNAVGGFSNKLNEFTKNKFDFRFVSSKNRVHTFSTNNGKLFVYTTNEHGGITNLTIKDK